MVTERLAMHEAREILRQKLTLGRSHREVVAAVGVSMGTVSKVVVRATALGLDWEAIEALDDEALDTRLYGPRCTTHDPRPLPEPAALHVEMRRPGVTLQLLHLEYLEQHPDGYRYTKFCNVYREWLDRRVRAPTKSSPLRRPNRPRQPAPVSAVLSTVEAWRRLPCASVAGPGAERVASRVARGAIATHDLLLRPPRIARGLGITLGA